MTYSRAQDRINAVDHAIRRARTQALSKSVDFALKHNDEVIDAKNKNYVKLDARIKKEMQTFQAKAIERRNKQK